MVMPAMLLAEGIRVDELLVAQRDMDAKAILGKAQGVLSRAGVPLDPCRNSSTPPSRHGTIERLVSS